MLATNNFNGHSGGCWLNISLSDTDGIMRGTYSTLVNEILWYHDKKKKVSPHQSVSWLGNVGPTSVEGWNIHSSTVLLEVLQKTAERWLPDPFPVSISPYPWVLKIPENCKAEKELRVVHCLLRNIPQNKALKLETSARTNLRIAILKKRKLKDSYLLISKSIIKL